MKIKGIIFDFDGTLFDTMSIWETAGIDYLKSIGCTAEKDLNKKLYAMSLLQSAGYLKEQYGLSVTTKEIISGINKIVEDFYYYHAMPKEGVIELLSVLKSKGIKMCIATATERHLIEAALKRCNISGFFEEIFTCSELKKGKNEPYIYEYACSCLNTKKSETIVCEDALYAAYTAKNAGFFVVGIYDKYESQTNELKKISDRYYINFIQISERGEFL